jgi:Trypsin
VSWAGRRCVPAVTEPSFRGCRLYQSFVGGTHPKPALAALYSSYVGSIQVPSPSSTYPFVVFLAVQIKPTSLELCTGSLVTPGVVLTAAHCLDETAGQPIRSITVYIGASYVHAQHVQRLLESSPASLLTCRDEQREYVHCR